MNVELKSLVAGAVLALLWFGESWAAFYPHFEHRFRERLRHDARNLFIGGFNAVLLYLAFGAFLVTVEAWSASRGFGLLRLLAWSSWSETVLFFVLFDMWMYWWHRANHAVPFLWRFHRAHHSETRMDASTGVRFHTGEVVLSAIARAAVVPLLGADLWQLALYEAFFLPVVLFHHSNVSLPRWLDHGLLAVIVSPAMHRVHHSRVRAETDSNYGSVFPYWDMLFRSFRLRRDARTIELGLDEFADERWQRLGGILVTPFWKGGRTARKPADSGGGSVSESTRSART